MSPRSTAFAALIFSATAAAQTREPDWTALNAETIQHFQALIRLDTTNPPGNEIRAVDYIKKVLDKEGIAYQIFAKDPARPSLVARLRGNGSKRPILLMGHTDTVSIDPKKWTTFGPFSGDKSDGFIYGRGSTDDKDSAVAYLMILVTLKRLNLPLDRDVIYVAEAAEEAGAGAWGIGYLVENHWDSIAAEFCLAEGGSIRRQSGEMIANLVGAAEKVPRGATLVARGPAGHGSRPQPDNPVLVLTEAVAKLGRWRPPMRLNDITRAYFERMAAISPPERAARFNGVSNPSQAASVLEYFAQNDPGHYAMLVTTITPTILRGGYQSNVIPSEAEATLDIRALPDEDMEKFYAEMRRIISNPRIEIVPRTAGLRPITKPSQLDTELFRALESVQKRLHPNLRTIPTMQTGATDMAFLREKGVQCYGIGPVYDVEDAAKGFGAHSDQERISEQGLYDFLRYAWGVVNEVAVKR